MELLKQVAARLHEIRKEMKLNQQQMGEIMGVSRASYSLYENGKLPIDVVMLDRLRQKTHLSTDYILGYTDKKSYAIDKVTVIKGSPPPLEKGYKSFEISVSELLAGIDNAAMNFKENIEAMFQEELKNREGEK